VRKQFALLSGGRLLALAVANHEGRALETQLWDTSTGEERASWLAPSEEESLRIDGGAVAGKDDNGVWIRDLATGALDHVAIEEPRKIDWTADGRWLAVQAQEGLDLVGPGGERRSIPGVLVPHDGLSADGSRMLAASGQVWETSTPRPLWRPDHQEERLGVLSPDGRWTAREAEHLVRVYDAAKGSLVAGFPLEASPVRWSFSPDSARLYAEADRLHVWDLATRRPIPLPRDAVALAFSRDGSLIAYVTQVRPVEEKPRIDVMIAATGRVVHHVFMETAPHRLQFSDDNRWLAAELPSDVRVIEIASGETRAIGRDESRDYVRDMAWSPDGSALALLSDESDQEWGSAARVWDFRSATFRGALTAPAACEPPGSRSCPRFEKIAWSPDGHGLALVRSDAVLLWDGRSPAPSGKLDAESSLAEGGRAAAFGRDGLLATSDRRSGEVRLWDTRSGARLRTVSLGDAKPEELAFSRDGTRLAAATFWTKEGGERIHGLRLIDARTGAVQKTIESARKSTGATVDLAWAPQGLAVVTMDEARGVELWSTTTDAPPLALGTDVVKAGPAALSPDGDTLITGDATLRVTNLRTASVVRDLPRNGRRVHALRFAPDGKSVAIARGTDVDVYRIADGATLHLLLNDARGVPVAAMAVADNGLFAGEPAAFARVRFREAGNPGEAPLETATQAQDFLRPALGIEFLQGCPVTGAP
jgi:WD40 repeat protein